MPLRTALAVLFVGLVMGSGAREGGTGPPKQGLVDLLLEYMEVRYPECDLQSDLLYVSVARQALFHVQDGRMVAEYPIATAKAGLGGQQDSYRTPTGLHRISEKIGSEVPSYGILKDRQFTGDLADPDFAGSTRIGSPLGSSGWKAWNRASTKAVRWIATPVTSTFTARPTSVPWALPAPWVACACAMPMSSTCSTAYRSAPWW